MNTHTEYLVTQPIIALASYIDHSIHSCTVIRFPNVATYMINLLTAFFCIQAELTYNVVQISLYLA